MATRVVVRGHVQGVFFRASMTDLARQHGVTGWVRNDPTGTVSAHLEGPPDDIDAVLAWVRAGGPPAARVADLEVHEVPDEDNTSFGVRR